MKTLLQINSSIFAEQGQSSQLANRFVARWQRENPGARVLVRDLVAKPVPHLTAERFRAFTTAPEQHTPDQAVYVAESDALIEELAAADVVVMGLPMYNFGVPSTLKAWIDHIARAGRTFKYTESGAVGLLGDRKVVIFAARGGHYLGTPADTQTAYITHIFNFIGLRSLEFIYAEGLALGDTARDEALAAAAREIGKIAA